MGTVRDLIVYQKAMDLAMQIFEASKSFPDEEKYTLVSQLRRSSRAVCACIGEAYRKRHYPKYFCNKLSDANMENTETTVWADFALNCGYIETHTYQQWLQVSNEVGRMLTAMTQHPEKFLPKTK